MAVFTKLSELDQQTESKNYQPATGWKADLMPLFGYDKYGQKTAFGTYAAHGNVLMDQYIPEALASGDAEEVIESGEADQWEHQFGTAQFAGNFVGGGGGSSFTGGSSGGSSGMGSITSMFGGGESGTGGITDMVGGMFGGGESGGFNMDSVTSMFGSGSGGGETGSSTSKLTQDLANAATEKGKEEIMKQINESSAEMSDEDVLKMAYDEYIEPEADENTTAGKKTATAKETDMGSSAFGDAGSATSDVPIVGEAIGLYGDKIEMAEAQKKLMREISNRQVGSTALGES